MKRILFLSLIFILFSCSSNLNTKLDTTLNQDIDFQTLNIIHPRLIHVEESDSLRKIGSKDAIIKMLNAEMASLFKDTLNKGFTYKDVKSYDYSFIKDPKIRTIIYDDETAFRDYFPSHRMDVKEDYIFIFQELTVKSAFVGTGKFTYKYDALNTLKRVAKEEMVSGVSLTLKYYLWNNKQLKPLAQNKVVSTAHSNGKLDQNTLYKAVKKMIPLIFEDLPIVDRSKK